MSNFKADHIFLSGLIRTLLHYFYSLKSCDWRTQSLLVSLFCLVSVSDIQVIVTFNKTTRHTFTWRTSFPFVENNQGKLTRIGKKKKILNDLSSQDKLSLEVRRKCQVALVGASLKYQPFISRMIKKGGFECQQAVGWVGQGVLLVAMTNWRGLL